MIKHIAAIIFIYVCTAIAWGILGGTVLYRTYNSDSSMQTRINELWGSVQEQRAPSVYYKTTRKEKQTNYRGNKPVEEWVTVEERHSLPVEATKLDVDLRLDHRRKGLLWYATYKVDFDSQYTFKNTTSTKQNVWCEFPLPAQQAIYDNFKMVLGDKTVSDVDASSNSVTQTITLDPGQMSKLAVSYDSQGLDQWRYSFGTGVSQVKDFKLSMKTDFDDIDFPGGSMSPGEKRKLDKGWHLTWRYANLVTGYTVGMAMPQKLNPGPWVSKVTFFAPVSLFLFFFLLFMFTTLKGLKVHPMNYFFIGCSFFSFHLLLSYLVDHISVELAFAIAALVSVLLVVSYMRIVVSNRFAFFEVGLAQLIYLIFFSYTFFYEKYTGLTITILCVITLFIMMQYTARTDWSEVFRRKGDKPSLPTSSPPSEATST